MSRTIPISLPLKVFEKIVEDIKGTSVKSVEAFIEALVMQKYPELNEPIYTEEEEELIKERLRKLGYL
uniref:CopG family transcriptional regulator n=1 Tax=viral metagenome TaxID=1070528 RepID=A0A6M3MAF4_9ZZZZ